MADPPRPAAGETAWALLIEYDGRPFVGWQSQATGTSVQDVLETAAAQLNGGNPVPSVVAGRTDAGVHAAGQVARIALATRLSADKVRDALNFHMLPHPVAVLRAAPAPEGWNPRFSAIGRAYRYRILNRRPRLTVDVGHAWHVERPLDVDRMVAGARHLLGRHDFTSFRAAACQAKSPVRTLDHLDVRREGDVIEIRAEARSFLHHQVRNLVGTLRQVGEGRRHPDDMARILAARARSAAGPTAPPDGLTLMEVRYPENPFNPEGWTISPPG